MEPTTISQSVVRLEEMGAAKARFVEDLAKTFSVTHAAGAAGACRQTVYRWREADADFARDWDDAWNRAVDTLEAVMFAKALAGETLPGFFLLKGARPKYRDNYIEPHAMQQRSSLRFLTDTERDDAIDAQYTVTQLPEHTGGE